MTNFLFTIFINIADTILDWTIGKSLDQVFPNLFRDKNKAIFEKYENVISDYKKKYEDEVSKSKKLKAEKKVVKFEKTELKKFLDKINETLQKENISKEELIKNIASSLKAVIFFKTAEDISQKRFLLRDQIYPEMGIISIRSGLAMLPPKRVPQDLSNIKIVEWFLNEIKSRLPEDYEYNMLVISVIDLNETRSFKFLQHFRRINFSYLDKIPVEELMSVSDVANYFEKKKHLASRDIIEIPNLVFLVEDYLISKSDLEKLKKNNNAILSEIKKEVGTEELKTTDFATIENSIVEKVLKKYTSSPTEIADRIKENSIFWKTYFENRLGSEHS